MYFKVAQRTGLISLHRATTKGASRLSVGRRRYEQEPKEGAAHKKFVNGALTPTKKVSESESFAFTSVTCMRIMRWRIA
jgi:hypothetical protein